MIRPAWTVQFQLFLLLFFVSRGTWINDATQEAPCHLASGGHVLKYKWVLKNLSSLLHSQKVAVRHQTTDPSNPALYPHPMPLGLWEDLLKNSVPLKNSAGQGLVSLSLFRPYGTMNAQLMPSWLGEKTHIRFFRAQIVLLWSHRNNLGWIRFNLVGSGVGHISIQHLLPEAFGKLRSSFQRLFQDQWRNSSRTVPQQDQDWWLLALQWKKK